ncbi:Xanthine_oxidase / Xanthine dehydrogenase [Hexamita inflata]|uniref:Xanthine oxidase / Xanthine dehydrogenase n=1 Tax=Hexamita inflata TaxID=28002 RepID=A0AA86P0L5_9EUKA|nr:Xanthine oxidase / Xanthine dehydrogenase [Hexamita inflata]
MSNKIILYVNGKRYEVAADPMMRLSLFLKQNELNGTKTSCKEGGCGACTVVYATYDAASNKIHYRTSLACLTPLVACDGAAITTIEALGTVQEPHELQQKFTKASQCGYCTPGIIMSVYAESLNEKLDMAGLRRALDGNICRCTGYNAINQVLADIEESMPTVTPPVFPEELKNYKQTRKILLNPDYNGEAYKNKITMIPKTYEDVAQFIDENEQVKFLSGGTEIMVTYKEKSIMPRAVCLLTGLPALDGIVRENGKLIIRANVTMTQFEHYLKTNKHPSHQFFKDIYELFASSHVRSMASLIANIVNANPVADNSPVFMALGAQLKVVNCKTLESKLIKLDNFFVGSNKTVLQKYEIVEHLEVEDEHMSGTIYYKKLARRRHDDIAVVNGCTKFYMKGDTITEAKVVFGCVSNKTVRMEHLEKIFQGLKVQKDTAEEIMQKIDEVTLKHYEMKLRPSGTTDYKSKMMANLTKKFFSQMVKEVIGHDMQYDTFNYLSDFTQENTCDKPKDEYSVITHNYKHLTALQHATGEAVYVSTQVLQDKALHAYPIFAGVPRGTFTYNFKGLYELQQKYPNIVDFITAKDIKGTNKIGVAIKDERVLVPVESEFVAPSEIIGVVVAKTHEDAYNISKLMLADKLIEIVENFDNIVTMQQAIEKSSYICERRLERIGDEQLPREVEKFNKLIEKLNNDPNIFKYHHSITTPPQEHFYLEPQCTIAEPTEDGITIFASTQNLKGVQASVADQLRLRMSDVTVRTKRLGGGFGGKEGIFQYACVPAICAWKLKRQVSLVLDYADDMLFTGKRHEAYIEGDVYVNKQTKKFEFLDVKAYIDAGYAADLSPAVMDRLVYHVDNAYKFANLRVIGKACKTNLRSNTAFRGFGAPQAVMFTETLIQSLSKQMHTCEDDLRYTNLYQSTDRTQYGQLIGQVPIKECLDQVYTLSKYKKMKEQVAEFNQRNKNVKQGLAVMPLKFGVSFGQSFLNQGHSLVHVFTDGSVAVSHGATEMGQGVNTRLLQVAAEEFKIKPDHVKILETSTITTANAAPTSASSGYDLNAAAVVNAIKQIKASMGDIYTKYVNKEITWPQACITAWLGRKQLSAAGHYSHPHAGFDFETQSGQPFCYFAASACVAHVQVNLITGEQQIIKAELMVDVGQSINPLIDFGQIEGAFMQGVGLITMEEFIQDMKIVNNKLERVGKYTSNGPGNYKVPLICDVPNEFNVHLLKNQYNDKIAYGSKGIGEPPLCLGTAVFLALRDAVGDDLQAPATTLNIWRAQKK